jgi:hypothetical protein
MCISSVGLARSKISFGSSCKSVVGSSAFDKLLHAFNVKVSEAIRRYDTTALIF